MWDEALETPRAVGARWVLAILLLSVAVRLLGVASAWDTPLKGDALFYSAQAKVIADGGGYTQPFQSLRISTAAESAEHPPLYVTYLAGASALGADSVRWHRVVSSLLGVGTTALVAVLGFRIGGRRTAIVSGILAATWPNLWYWDVGVQSESIAALTVAAFSVAGMAFLRRPSLPRIAAVGALVGLCALGRAELLLCAATLPLLVWAVENLSRPARVGWLAASAIATLAVIAPWAAFNTARFDHPVTLSTGAGLVLVSANCDSTYYGPLIGYWRFGCSVSGSTAAGILPDDDQSTADSLQRPVAVTYARDNIGRTPAVATARAARYLGLWHPTSASRLATTNEGMSQQVYLTSQAAWLAACGLALVAGAKLRAEGRRLSPLLAPVVVGLVTAVATYGIIRFRAPLEPPIIALASAGAVILLDRFAGDHHGGADQAPEAANPASVG